MAVAKDFQSLIMSHRALYYILQKSQDPRTAVQSFENKGKPNVWCEKMFALIPKNCEFKEVSFTWKPYLVY